MNVNGIYITTMHAQMYILHGNSSEDYIIHYTEPIAGVLSNGMAAPKWKVPCHRLFFRLLYEHSCEDSQVANEANVGIRVNRSAPNGNIRSQYLFNML